MDLNSDLSAILLAREPLYQIGIVSKSATPSQLYCRSVGDNENSEKVRGSIFFGIGSSDLELERTDRCEDGKLVEYSCTRIPDWFSDANRGTGKGYTATAETIDCKCSGGVCP